MARNTLHVAVLCASCASTSLAEAEIALSITQPPADTCTFPDLEVKTGVLLSGMEPEDFVSSPTYAGGRVCVEIEGGKGDRGRVPSAGTSSLCTGVLDSSPFQFAGLAAGCHRLTALLEDAGGDIISRSPPVSFQVASSDLECQEQLCSAESTVPVYWGRMGSRVALPAETSDVGLFITSPRDSDTVFSDHVLLSLSLQHAGGALSYNFSTVCVQPSVAVGPGEEEGVGLFRDLLTECVHNVSGSVGLEIPPPEVSSPLLPRRVRVRVRAQAEPGSGFSEAEGTFLVGHHDPRSFLGSPAAGGLPREAQERVVDAGMVLGAGGRGGGQGEGDDRGAVLGGGGRGGGQGKGYYDQGAMAMLPLVLVCNRWEEDVSWLGRQPFPAVVYERKPPRNMGRHAVPFNLGNEAAAYLKFIVDYYDVLPERMLFLHSHRLAYHQEDLLILLHRLRPEEADYCNINSMAWGDKENIVLGDESYIETQWHWLEKWLGPRPALLLHRCCAQFLVHRDRVRRHPVEFYLEGLARMSLSVDKEESRRWGLLFEWLWHYIFGEPAVSEELAHLLPLLKEVDRVKLGDRAACMGNSPDGTGTL